MLSTISTPRLALSESHYWTVPAFSRREIKRRRHWPLGSAFVDTYRVKVLHPNHANSIRVSFLHQKQRITLSSRRGSRNCSKGGGMRRKIFVDTRINACTHKNWTKMQLFLSSSFSRGLSSIFCFVLLLSFIFEI